MKNELGEDISWVEKLDSFIDTSSYHRLGAFNAVLTDGAKYVADHADCYWLFEAVQSLINEHVRYNNLCFDNKTVTAIIEVDQSNYSANLILDNTNKKIIAQKYIDFTNFPLSRFEYMANYYSKINAWVHMLISEY